MKKFSSFVFAGALLAAGSVATPSIAADPGYWDQPSPTFDWTGFYAGIQGGGGWSRSRLTEAGGTVNQNPSGGYIGGYVSGLWQHDWLIWGTEAELNYGWISRTDPIGAPGDAVGQRIDWFGSVNAVVGLPVDRALIYATGGLAVGTIGQSQNIGPITYSQTRTTAGWTLGAGIDYAVTDDIIVGARYRYYDFGAATFNPPAPFTSPRTQRTNLHTIGARVAVKF